MIQVKNVWFSYDGKTDILKDITFSVSPGEIVTILGPNGSGKTTMLKCIDQIIKPYKGEIYFCDKNLLTLERKEISKLISYVPQESKITFPYSVLDIILLGRTPHIGMFSLPKKEDVEKVIEVMKFLNILHLKDKMYTKLSGGERKMCLIARALVTDAKVMLLDEPTAFLDIKHEYEVLNCIKKLTLERKLIIIMTLHNPNIASFISDRILLMRNGSIVLEGSPGEIINEENIKKFYDCEIFTVSYNDRKFIFPKINLS